MLLKLIIIVTLIVTSMAEDNCHKLLRELGNCQEQFIYCVTTHSAPVTMCTTCIDNYSYLTKAYDKIATDPECTAKYFDKDRINMVASANAVLVGLWSKAYCADCSNNNNSQVFEQKNQVLYDCLSNYPKTVCEVCKRQYMDLNNFYIHLDQHNNGEVCYDLQDSMNRTRSNWSKDYKCCRREYNMTLFTIALCMVSCLPFLFYGGTYFLTKRQERNHGILNDEDPLFNASTPSTSATSTLNINNPLSSGSNININNNSSSTNTTKNVNLPKTNKAGFNILNEEPDENDPPIANKKVFNLLDDDDESSDDENVVDVVKHYKKN